jgi:hypothetical protein
MLLVVAVGVLATAPIAVASRDPRIYIVDACGEMEAVKPAELELGCSGAGENFPYADHIVYHGYGRHTATATATFNICLLSPPGQPVGPFQTWRGCPYADLSVQEEAEAANHRFRGSFRFSHIVRCYGMSRKGKRGTRLFYAETSYTYANRAWEWSAPAFADTLD